MLQNNIKNGCFILSKKGINFRMTDSNKKILIDFEMQAENFMQYKFKQNTSLSIGLNFSHFYKMVKSIKKKDSIVLFINEDNETELGIRVIPKEKNRVTTSFIKIQNLQSKNEPCKFYPFKISSKLLSLKTPDSLISSVQISLKLSAFISLSFCVRIG